MVRTAKITAWVSQDEMLRWLKEADTKEAYQRRLAIWISTIGSMPAAQIAELLGVSVQAIWKWTSEFNHSGPEGLDRKGRGGRQRSIVSLEDEIRVVGKIRKLRARKPVPSLRSLVPMVCAMLGQPVSEDYIYRLMRRHT